MDENAVRDSVKKYEEARNNKWEEMGVRSRAGENILKAEEIKSLSPELKEHLTKMGMEHLLDSEKLENMAKTETIMKMMTIGSNPAKIYSNGDQSPLKGAEAQVLDKVHRHLTTRYCVTRRYRH